MIGSVITQVTGNDVDSGPALSYTLHLDANSQGLFGIHRFGGAVSLTGLLDYEERTWYTLTVRSSDSKHQSEANITVLVDDVNDNAPTFTQDLYQVQPSSHTSLHLHQLILTVRMFLNCFLIASVTVISTLCFSLGDCIRAPPSRQCSHHSNSHRS